MQTKDIVTELASLLSRLIPSRVSVLQGDDGEPQLFLSMAVGEDRVLGQRWRNFERGCPRWRDLVGRVTVTFMESCHLPRSWGVSRSLVADGEGLVPDGAGPAAKVLLAFTLTEPGDVVAEELPQVKTVTFDFVPARERSVPETTKRRHLAVVRVPPEEREGC